MIKKLIGKKKINCIHFLAKYTIINKIVKKKKNKQKNVPYTKFVTQFYAKNFLFIYFLTKDKFIKKKNFIYFN